MHIYLPALGNIPQPHHIAHSEILVVSVTIKLFVLDILTKCFFDQCGNLLLQTIKILSANIKDLVRQSLILIHAYYKTSHIQACFLMPIIQVTIDK